MCNKIYFEQLLQTAWSRQVTSGVVGFLGVTFDVDASIDGTLAVTARHSNTQQGLLVPATNTQALYDYAWSVWTAYCATQEKTICPACTRAVIIPTENELRAEQEIVEQYRVAGIQSTANPWVLNDYYISYRCPCKLWGVDAINLPYDYSAVEFKQTAWFAIWNGSLGMCQP